MEKWKRSSDIPRVEVSNLGNIRSYKTKKKWYTKPDKLGYIAGQYTENNKVKSFKLHRLVAREFVSNPEGYLEVNHIDGVKSNCASDNLEWCTRQHNVRHSFEMGLNKPHKGSKNGRAVLDEKLVEAICDYFQESTENTPKKAVEHFNISMQQATKIRAKISWKHITEKYDFIPLKSRSKFRD